VCEFKLDRGDCDLVFQTMLDVLPGFANHAAEFGVRLAFEPLNPVLFNTDIRTWNLELAGIDRTRP
jgi:hypothetical protein